MTTGDTYHILMRIHENVKAIILSNPQHLNCMLDPFLIVFPRASRLDSLPRKEITDGVVPAALQPREVEVRLLLGEGSARELDIVAIEEVVGHMGRRMRLARILAVTGDIDTPQDHLSTLCVAEFAIFDYKAEGRHNAGLQSDNEWCCARDPKRRRERAYCDRRQKSKGPTQQPSNWQYVGESKDGRNRVDALSVRAPRCAWEREQRAMMGPMTSCQQGCFPPNRVRIRAGFVTTRRPEPFPKMNTHGLGLAGTRWGIVRETTLRETRCLRPTRLAPHQRSGDLREAVTLVK